jgi:LacI family transcriptional regulator
MSITIKKIAEMAGVSRGTVDRVLNGRPGVKPSIRENVLQIAEKMNYVPHLAAKALALSKNPVSFGIVMPPLEIIFFNEIRNGIHEAEKELKDLGIRLEFRYVSNLEPSEAVAAVDELTALGVSGIMFSAMDDETIRNCINDIVNKGIPVITFNSDVCNCSRLCYVGQDLYQSGRVAAGLMSRVVEKGAKIIIVTGNIKFQAHKARVDGFSDRIRELNSPLDIIEILQGFDQYTDTYDKLMTALTKNSNIQGIYMATGDIGACCDVLEQCKLESKIHVICNDILPAVIKGMQEGIIDFTIVQNPFIQGYKSLKLLYDYVFSGKLPDSEYVFTETGIVLLENLSQVELHNK